jgi:hypothetical protein
MTTSEMRDLATVGAAVIALLVFVFNSFFQLRNRRIENLSRFFDVHRRLFERDGFIIGNLPGLEADNLARADLDGDQERKFHSMLLEVERLAILANNRAVPDSTQVYMFGWYAKRLLNLVTDKERNNMFWELALSYLQRLAALTTVYEAKSPGERGEFHK